MLRRRPRRKRPRRRKRKRIKRARKLRPLQFEKRLFFHIPFSRIRDYISYINERKPDLEIYFDGDALDELEGTTADVFLRDFSYSPNLTVHGPFMDLSPGAVDPLIRDVTLKRFFQVLDLSGKLRAEVVVFHSGFEKWKYDHAVDVWLNGSLKTWGPVLERAGEYGIRIAIENIFEDNPANLKALVEAVNSPDFGLCFDTGHFNIFSSVSLREWIELVGEHIIELHVHDNDGTRDYHCAPGTGTFDFAALFGLLKTFNRTDIVYTVEAHSLEEVERAADYMNAAW
ncbi:MAG TPA: sugar phosphate isomerase/epimerase [Nitrospirae bacterium]|nr:sugar phosphate isomerase/epimerase [Nitrospirota bacterium]HDY71598.1 sugar phosphate isomerase/epimerase [Nitrospirota bacterium]